MWGQEVVISDHNEYVQVRHIPRYGLRKVRNIPDDEAFAAVSSLIRVHKLADIASALATAIPKAP